jgi:hypothetical protein
MVAGLLSNKVPLPVRLQISWTSPYLPRCLGGDLFQPRRLAAIPCPEASSFVGDVVAGHGVTPFLQAARAAGCKTSDGFQMVEAGIEVMPGFLLCK